MPREPCAAGASSAARSRQLHAPSGAAKSGPRACSAARLLRSCSLTGVRGTLQAQSLAADRRSRCDLGRQHAQHCWACCAGRFAQLGGPPRPERLNDCGEESLESLKCCGSERQMAGSGQPKLSAEDDGHDRGFAGGKASSTPRAALIRSRSLCHVIRHGRTASRAAPPRGQTRCKGQPDPAVGRESLRTMQPARQRSWATRSRPASGALTARRTATRTRCQWAWAVPSGCAPWEASTTQQLLCWALPVVTSACIQ